jgi:hypothetical protein
LALTTLFWKLNQLLLDRHLSVAEYGKTMQSFRQEKQVLTKPTFRLWAPNALSFFPENVNIAILFITMVCINFGNITGAISEKIANLYYWVQLKGPFLKLECSN